VLERERLSALKTSPATDKRWPIPQAQRARGMAYPSSNSGYAAEDGHIEEAAEARRLVFNPLGLSSSFLAPSANDIATVTMGKGVSNASWPVVLFTNR